jgi:hypothetical protein
MRRVTRTKPMPPSRSIPAVLTVIPSWESAQKGSLFASNSSDDHDWWRHQSPVLQSVVIGGPLIDEPSVEIDFWDRHMQEGHAQIRPQRG